MRRVIGLLLIPTLAAACGDAIDPITGGEGNGATGFSIIVTDDPANDPGPNSPGSPNELTGQMSGSIRVLLRNDANALVDLGLVQDIEIPLQDGSDSLRLPDVSRPPTDTYTGIQLRFEGVTVRVESGSEVGDSTLASDVVMNVGSANLATVEIATETFDVDSNTDMDIVVDLNSELWVTGANLDDNLVPQADLANNVSVEIP